MRKGKLLTASFTLALALGACTDTKNTNEASTASPTPAAQTASAESPAAATPTPALTPTPEPTPMPEPPRTEEARATVARVYKGAVTTDEREGWTVVGDFNGDGSEDLVARVRPARDRIDELNDDLANWLISDPQKVQRPDPRKFDPHQGVQKLTPSPERPRVAANDSLLVVIHGYKEEGWRSPDASQTYLLHDASGADLRAQSRRDAKVTTLGQNPPRLMGDVIRQTLNGRQGFLYWNGATYGWFHPEREP
ncbi:MAG TPA: hypothetical protein VM936_14165 [Pyrinomonadaceae bacterium]|jgi:hypothetical protein|nr:hypothetical protein [Pyrinomonadaceae bacterium]